MTTGTEDQTGLARPPGSNALGRPLLHAEPARRSNGPFGSDAFDTPRQLALFSELTSRSVRQRTSALWYSPAINDRLASRCLDLKQFGDVSPQADPDWNTGQCRHDQRWSEHRRDQPGHWWQATQLTAFDLEQADARGRPRTAVGTPAMTLVIAKPDRSWRGVLPQRQRQRCSASRTAAQAERSQLGRTPKGCNPIPHSPRYHLLFPCAPRLAD